MAEDEDGVPNKNLPENSNNCGPFQSNESGTTRPDLGIESACYNNVENEDDSPTDRLPAEAKSSSSKSTGATRKEENPFSFRHFLKRDLSLPGSSTYENTGARPKVYANTVQHSPTKIDIHSSPKHVKGKSLTKETNSDGSSHRLSDNSPSTSSVEIPFSVVDNSESKHNLYSDNTESPFYHRPNLAAEPLGMPSLPDFVQDHILVEQAYLNSNGPISVDLDNLPDFTFNTSYSAGSSSLGRRTNGGYASRDYDYDPYLSGASTSNASQGIPLDLPVGAEAAGAVPLDLGAHLSLDLTESVNPADRRNVSPRNTFPLDLPSNAGAESMRLPDFLPVHPGRTSPEPEHQDAELQQIIAELERTRSELFSERARRTRLEEELAAARRRPERDDASQATDVDSTIAKLKKEIKRLKEELESSRNEAASLRARQSAAAGDLRRAASRADTSLRDLLAGLEHLRSLSTNLDQT